MNFSFYFVKCFICVLRAVKIDTIRSCVFGFRRRELLLLYVRVRIKRIDVLARLESSPLCCFALFFFFFHFSSCFNARRVLVRTVKGNYCITFTFFFCSQQLKQSEVYVVRRGRWYISTTHMYCNAVRYLPMKISQRDSRSLTWLAIRWTRVKCTMVHQHVTQYGFKPNHHITILIRFFGVTYCAMGIAEQNKMRRTCFVCCNPFGTMLLRAQA